MVYLRIFIIVSGVFIVILSVLEYFFQPNHSFFISKRMQGYLGENELTKHRKTKALPGTITGTIIILSALLFDYDIFQ